MPPRAPYVVPALKKHTATVIMAHGLGDRLVFHFLYRDREGFSLTDSFLRIVALDGTFTKPISTTAEQRRSDAYALKLYRMSLAQNWRRRGMFDEVAFIFPNAPMIPITVVCLWTRCVG